MEINDYLLDKLKEYCQKLAIKYNETLDGYYRIKYNDLYSFLYYPATNAKKEELFNSFITSMNINPIKKITKTKIIFKEINIKIK